MSNEYMKRKLLAIFAHPDDEAFGPGGALAAYGAQGVEIHLLCATRGEAGQMSNEVRIKNQESRITEESKIEKIREEEVLESAKVLGIKRVEFLDFIDGRLCNANYHDLAGKIIKKIEQFAPQVVMTFDRLGGSGHLDHIAVAMTTTYAYLHTKKPKKLYYHCLPKKWRNKTMDEYFIYFPEGYDDKDITTIIDFNPYWDKKIKAMYCHKSQMKDVKNILKYWVKRPRQDHFILQMHRNINISFPETDLFAGIAS